MRRKAILIAGPTASGKSAFALERAESSGGIIVNADSMQVYDVLNVLTARPSARDLARADHRLYGFVAPEIRCSVGQWLAAVSSVIGDPEIMQRELIFVGGTGLYFDALENGIAAIPDIPAEAVAEAEALVTPLDREGRLALLKARDPELAKTLGEPDPQRLTRALSVLFATGRSLAYWQRRAGPPPLDGFELERIVIDVKREALSSGIKTRFRKMLDSGAIEEVAELKRRALPADLPAMKAIGVREIAAWQAGMIGREEAVERAVAATRQYAKRQRTWFRQRMGHWYRFSSSEAER